MVGDRLVRAGLAFVLPSDCSRKFGARGGVRGGVRRIREE